MQATFRCEGSRVFVFGGTSGINLGIAEAFAEAGARVAVASRSAEKVEAAVARLTETSQRFGHGRTASGYPLDVRDATAVVAALDAFGGLDVVVSGAAGNFLAHAAALTPNGYERQQRAGLCHPRGARGDGTAALAHAQAYARERSALVGR